jgi:hypothetical protein
MHRPGLTITHLALNIINPFPEMPYPDPTMTRQ